MSSNSLHVGGNLNGAVYQDIHNHHGCGTFALAAAALVLARSVIFALAVVLATAFVFAAALIFAAVIFCRT